MLWFLCVKSLRRLCIEYDIVVIIFIFCVLRWDEGRLLYSIFLCLIIWCLIDFIMIWFKVCCFGFFIVDFEIFIRWNRNVLERIFYLFLGWRVVKRCFILRGKNIFFNVFFLIVSLFLLLSIIILLRCKGV